MGIVITIAVEEGNVVGVETIRGGEDTTGITFETYVCFRILVSEGTKGMLANAPADEVVTRGGTTALEIASGAFNFVVASDNKPLRINDCFLRHLAKE